MTLEDPIAPEEDPIPQLPRKKRVHEPAIVPEPIFVSLDVGARLIDVSRPYLYDMIKNGQVRAKKLGSATKLDYRSLLELRDTLPDHGASPKRNRDDK